MHAPELLAPVKAVVKVAGHALHGGLGAAWVPPVENCPSRHVAQVAPPVPAGQMLTAGASGTRGWGWVGKVVGPAAKRHGAQQKRGAPRGGISIA